MSETYWETCDGKGPLSVYDVHGGRLVVCPLCGMKVSTGRILSHFNHANEYDETRCLAVFGSRASDWGVCPCGYVADRHNEIYDIKRHILFDHTKEWLWEQKILYELRK